MTSRERIYYTDKQIIKHCETGKSFSSKPAISFGEFISKHTDEWANKYAVPASELTGEITSVICSHPILGTFATFDILTDSVLGEPYIP